jgi:adenylate kinase family enzyme
MNYIICGSQNSGKTTQAYALAGSKPLKVTDIADIRYMGIEEDHTSIVIDEVKSLELLRQITKNSPPFRYREKFSKEILEVTLPIIVVTSLPVEVCLFFYAQNLLKENWSLLATKFPKPVLNFSEYEKNC